MVNSRILLSLFLILFITTSVQGQNELQSPEEFLGYELGEQWTPHYKVLNYFKHVSEQSPLVTFQQYGTTNEGRELAIVKVSSEANQKKMEQIRTDNLKRAGLMEGDPVDNISIVWLSYNVHGNETSSSEAALKTIYELVRPDNQQSKQWLVNTVVIMDPMLNPDGRDRYVNWYRQVVGEQYNARPEAREHDEPWPGGRTNHYYFDLNRDWAWLIQKESRHRMEVYQQWLPQIHVDFHEQSYNSPYYFAPAAKPFHTAITDWQREFQYTIGENHAEYFDENSWLYFTREVFDLFYPSYGDTYPIFNGAIGMTYEQAGGGSAGLGIETAEGDTLSLTDRLTHHYTTGISTVEITSKHADEVVSEFAAYYEQSANNPSGDYASFVIKADNNPDNITALLELLDRHNIEYRQAADSESMDGFNYRSGQTERVEIAEGDYVIDTHQPKSVLARVLFEPQPELVDSLTYDITAWEQHYAYGLEGFALTEQIETREASVPQKNVNNAISGQPYAYLAEWKDPADVKMLADLLKQGVKVRFAEEPFSIDERDYDRGTLIITRNGNEAMAAEFDEKVQDIATAHNQQLYDVATGFVTSGPDFGSSSVNYLEAPKVALLSGDGTSSGMVGEIWHYFDQQIEYPVTLLNLNDFQSGVLRDYDVLILPSGFYGNALGESQLNEILQWVREGGRLIAVGGANGFLSGKEGFALSSKDTGDSSEADNENENMEQEKLDTYAERQRERIPNSNPGSVFKITMDNTHPLAFGYDDVYFSLKLSTSSFAYLDNGWNVGAAREGAHMSGFLGSEAEEKLKETLTFGVQNSGGGAIIYMVDNPLFRAFWHNGKLLFGNAVFMVGQ